MLKVNPFLRIHFLYEIPYLTLVNIDKNYKVSDFIVFILFIIKSNNYSVNELLDYINNETSYSLDTDNINKLIGINVISETDYKDSLLGSIWNTYNWEEAYNYLYLTKDYPFLDYESGKTFIEDQNKMEEYIWKGKMPPEKRNINTSEEYKLQDDLKLDISIKDIYDGKTTIVNEIEKISLLFNSWFWFQGRNYLWFWRFPKKIVPSWWSRHPSEWYLFDFTGTFKKWWVFYYDWEENKLKLVNKYSNLEKQINIVSNWYLEKLDFVPKYWIAITSNLLRSMWRYRDSRSYRVLFNDVWHITSILCTLLQSMWVSFTEFSFIKEDKLLECTNSKIVEDQFLEKPIYFLLFK